MLCSTHVIFYNFIIWIISLFNNEITNISKTLLKACEASNIRIALAESCTGGLISASLTEIPGSSNVFEIGFITYSNYAKIKELRVPEDLIDSVGAVSKEVACAMADGALATSRADLSLGITGVAGPDGGSEEKPVGLVHLAVAGLSRPTSHQKVIIPGDRSVIRMGSVSIALNMLLRAVRDL